MDQDAGAALAGFAWQAGYGAFSVSESNVPKVSNYIRDQEEYHRVKTFQEEFRTFLAKQKSSSMNGMFGIEAISDGDKDSP